MLARGFAEAEVHFVHQVEGEADVVQSRGPSGRLAAGEVMLENVTDNVAAGMPSSAPGEMDEFQSAVAGGADEGVASEDGDVKEVLAVPKFSRQFCVQTLAVRGAEGRGSAVGGEGGDVVQERAGVFHMLYDVKGGDDVERSASGAAQVGGVAAGEKIVVGEESVEQVSERFRAFGVDSHGAEVADPLSAAASDVQEAGAGEGGELSQPAGSRLAVGRVGRVGGEPLQVGVVKFVQGFCVGVGLRAGVNQAAFPAKEAGEFALDKQQAPPVGAAQAAGCGRGGGRRFHRGHSLIIKNLQIPRKARIIDSVPFCILDSIPPLCDEQQTMSASVTPTSAATSAAPADGSRPPPDSRLAEYAGVDDIARLLKKGDLSDPSGVSYWQFRRGLSPRYGAAWMQIAAGWAACFALAGLHAALAEWSVVAAVAAIPVFATGVGFGVAFLQLFLHEAAHWNLHPRRGANDLLSDLFVSGPVGMDVGSYRPIHFDHHRFLGSPADTEISYFDPLNIRFVAESLLGVKALRTIRRRSRRLSEKAGTAEKKAAAKSGRKWLVFVYGAVFNGGLLLFLALGGWWPAALAWALGVAVFFPFFGALRQLLEHRDEHASDGADYTETVHGAVHRLFGDGMVASTLGGAGFNRHLLHHWDPQLSCTRLRELERFLTTTQARGFLEGRRTTYGRTFRKLFHFGVRG